MIIETFSFFLFEFCKIFLSKNKILQLLLLLYNNFANFQDCIADYLDNFTIRLPALERCLPIAEAFLSCPRQEYFRKFLCNLLGTWVENGEYRRIFKYLGG
jgi:hypothetical protein